MDEGDGGATSRIPAQPLFISTAGGDFAPLRFFEKILSCGAHVAGAASYDQGGLAGQFFKATPFGLNTTNQLAETGSALYSLRGLLGFDTLNGMNNAMAQLMSIPFGAGGLSQNVNFGGNAIGANS